MTVYKLYNIAKEYLRKNKLPTFEEDSSYIISSLLSIPKSSIFLDKEKPVSFFETMRIKMALKKRRKNIPLAYILGYQHFYENKFIVDKKTFIPKFDTEHIIYEILKIKKDFKNIIDICTGSGILALTLGKIYKNSSIIGIDRYIKIANKNRKLLNIENVKFLKMDFLKNKDFKEKFDLIVSNPPYLSKEDFKLLGKDSKYEPFYAFYGGEDGLVFYRKIRDFSLSNLLKDGFIVLEVDHKWEKVKNLFNETGYKNIKVVKDYNNLERVLVIRKE